MHKNFSPLFNPAIADDAKNVFRDRIMGKFMYIDSQLASATMSWASSSRSPTMLRWADSHKFDLSALKNLMAFKERVGARPTVQEALAKEGLPKAA